MKKTFLAIITVMAILFTMTACGGTTTPSASDAPAQPAAPQAQDAGSEPVSEPVGGAFTIGFSFPTSNNEFWQNAVNYFKMASSDLGFTRFPTIATEIPPSKLLRCGNHDFLRHQCSRACSAGLVGCPGHFKRLQRKEHSSRYHRPAAG